MNKKKLLIVDDDSEIRELLQEYLTRAGFEIQTAGDGEQMHRTLQHYDPDLIILDVMMPGDDGFTLCRQLRETRQTPIIMLTAASDEADRVIGLELGADDYLGKPFGPRELLARIKALLRRSILTQPQAPRYFQFDQWRLDSQSRSLLDSKTNQPYELSSSEYNLLHLFVTHPNQILTRDQISDATRGREALPLERGTDVLLSRLRQRLGDKGKNPKIIKTIRGRGYIMVCDVQAEY